MSSRRRNKIFFLIHAPPLVAVNVETTPETLRRNNNRHHSHAILPLRPAKPLSRWRTVKIVSSWSFRGSADTYAGAGSVGGGLSRRAVSAAHLSSLTLSQSLAPPTEVPLRATQASEDMRAGMGVFRLNPFTMHSLSVNAEDGTGITDDVEWEATQPSWCGGEPRALEEEPLIYEFQLDLYDLSDESQVPEAEEGAGLSELSQSRSSITMAWSEQHQHLSSISRATGPEDEDQLQSFSPILTCTQKTSDSQHFRQWVLGTCNAPEKTTQTMKTKMET